MALTNLLPTNWTNKTMTPAANVARSVRGVNDPFDQIHNEIQSLFDGMFGTDSALVTPFCRANIGAGVLRPTLDIDESEQSYTISVDMPGVDQDDIQLSVDQDTLMLSAKRQRKVEEQDNNAQFHRVERSFGRYERALTLPADANSDEISASYRNGVLEIEIPRLESVAAQRGRRISISSGD